MHRRDLLRLLGAAAILPVVPREAEAAIIFGRTAHQASRSGRLRSLADDEARLVTLLADIIIPRTDTPGAIDVGVPGFIDHLLTDWYAPEDRAQLREGLRRILETGFLDLAADQQQARLTALDAAKGEPGSPEAAFASIKSLTVYGYFTAEPVVKEVTRVPVIPGQADGCVPLRRGPA